MIENGDLISLNIPERRLDLLISDEEIDRRRKKWRCLDKGVTSPVLRRYANLVTTASKGAVLKKDF